MARTPIPSDTVTRTPRLSTENVAHLERLNDNVTEALNSELDFLRGWGLPAHYTRRLEAEAKRRGVVTMELVNRLLWTETSAYPPAPMPKAVHAPKELTKYVINITGPNDAWVMHHADVWHLSYYEALARALDFCRNYELPPEQLAALEQRAKASGDTPRDLVREFLMKTADGLPEGVPPPAPTKRQHLRRR